MARPAIAVALPSSEATPVAAELRAAGFTVATVTHPDELEALLATRRDVAVAILDGETDLDQSLEYYSLLRDDGRAIPALMVVSERTLGRLDPNSGGGRGRVLHPALFGRVAALARRGDVHPQPDRRRRLGPGPAGRPDRDRGLDRARDDHRGLQPQGRRRQDDHRDEPRLGPPDASRPQRPARRRRHGHGPRHDVARHRRRADPRRQLARRGGGRSARDARRDRLGAFVRA